MKKLWGDIVLKKICAVYARVSTDMQGESLENQVDYAREYIRRLGEGFEVDAAYVYQDFDQSGYYTRFIDRPAIQKALQDAEDRRYDVIVFKEISRISRDQAEHVEIVTRFTQNKVRLIAINDNVDTARPETLDLLGIHSVMSEMESKRISSRVSSGKKSLARRGHWIGESPIGYRVDSDSKRLVVDEEFAEIRKLIFKLFTKDGLGTFKIAEYLNERHMFSKNGNMWSRVTVNRVLRNPAYVGDIVYGKTRNKLKREYDKDGRYVKKMSRDVISPSDWIVVEDAHPKLIDHETFDEAQRIMQGRSKQNPRRSRHPLTGVLKCGVCGAGMICQKRIYRGKEYRYYYCSTAFKFGKAMCTQQSVNADKLESAVTGLLIQTLSQYSNAGATVTANKASDTSIERKHQQLQRELSKSRMAYSRLLGDTEISEETFNELKKAHVSRISQIEAEIEELNQSNRMYEEQRRFTLNISSYLKRLQESTGDLEETRRVFQELINSVVIQDKSISDISLKYQYV